MSTCFLNRGRELRDRVSASNKVGNDSYYIVWGMIPMLRNCFAYFEMSVSTPMLLSMMLACNFFVSNWGGVFVSGSTMLIPLL